MKKILMVDDVSTNLRLVTEVLKGMYEVHSARSGEQALSLMESTRPDLVLLDIGMPRMDGYSVMEHMSDRPELSGIPVIMLTGDTTREAEAKALNMGAVDFIRKPFEPIVLKARIEKALSVADIKADLEISSKKDSLTGLWNRIYLEEYFDRKPEDASGTLMMLDLDNFKALNDTYGHVVGDKSLVAFGNTIIEHTNNSDVVSRIGGDEFVIVRPGVYDRETLRNFCRELIASVEIHISEVVGEILEQSVTVSIGIAQFPSDGTDFLELYNAADKALYYVKQNGKRGYHFFQDDCRTLAEMTRENNLINMEQLKLLINENSAEKGAYQVEYEGFTRIFRFVNRCVERTGQNVQVVLFTLKLKDGEVNHQYVTEAMELLENNIAGLLRRADVATRFSVTQFGVILMDANKDNGMIAVNRVLSSFEEKGISEHVDLVYEIQDVIKE